MIPGLTVTINQVNFLFIRGLRAQGGGARARSDGKFVCGGSCPFIQREEFRVPMSCNTGRKGDIGRNSKCCNQENSRRLSGSDVRRKVIAPQKEEQVEYNILLKMYRMCGMFLARIRETAHPHKHFFFLCMV